MKQNIAKILLCLTMVLLNLLPVTGFAQSVAYQITGKLKGIEKGQHVYLYYNGAVHDSAVVKNGKFTLTGHSSQARIAYLQLRHPEERTDFLGQSDDQLPIYINEDKLVIKGSGRIVHARVSGSEMTEGYRHYLAYMDKHIATLKQVRAQLNASFGTSETGQIVLKDGITGEYIDSLQQIVAVEAVRERVLQEEYVASHPESPFTLVVLRDVLTGNRPKDIQKSVALFHNLAPAVKNTSEAKLFYAFLQKNVQASIGNVAPDFALPDIHGNPVSLSAFRGKYVLIDFWASWCAPCRAAHPALIKTYERFKDRGYTVISISLDDDRDRWLKAIQDDNIPWEHHISDLKGWKNEVAVQYGIRSVPYNLLVGPDGKIVARNVIGGSLDSILDSRLISDAEGSNRIKGRIIPHGDLQHASKVILSYSLNGNPYILSDTVINNVFQIHIPDSAMGRLGQLSIQYAELSEQENLLRRFMDCRHLYMEKGGVGITIDGNVKQAVVTGQDQNRFLDAYFNSVDPIQWGIDSLRNVSATMPVDEYREAMKAANDSLTACRENFVRTHPASWYSLIVLDMLVKNYLANAWSMDTGGETLQDYLLLYEGLVPELKSQAAYIHTQLELSKQQKFIPFTGEMPNGEIFDVASLKGRVFLIDFWGSWCVWCRKGHPHMKELYEKYKGQGFEIVGIGHEMGDDRQKQWAKFKDAIAKDGITWPQVLNNPSEHDLIKAYLVNHFPTKILVDCDGKVLLRVTSDNGRKLDMALKKLFE